MLSMLYAEDRQIRNSVAHLNGDIIENASYFYSCQILSNLNVWGWTVDHIWTQLPFMKRWIYQYNVQNEHINKWEHLQEFNSNQGSAKYLDSALSNLSNDKWISHYAPSLEGQLRFDWCIIITLWNGRSNSHFLSLQLN